MSIEAAKAIQMVYANTTKHDWPDDIWDAICKAIEAEKQAPDDLTIAYMSGFHDGKKKRELLGYAGVKVWVGNQQVCRVLTQIELHHAVSPWRTVEMAAMACIAKLKEKNI